MSTGADNKTMPVTKEYEDGYERTFGDRKPERGLWIWNEAEKRLVKAEDYKPPERALDAPIMVDRFYENTTIPVYENGQVKQADIGSRRKHRTFLKDRGLTTIDDFDKPGGEWERAAKERAQRQQGIFPDARERRDELGKIAYEVDKRHVRRR